MPRKPRNRGILRKDSGIGLSDDQLTHLIKGWCWLDSTFPFESETHRKECWERHKRAIFNMMSDNWRDAGFKPHLLCGERPEAFYEFETVPARKSGQNVPEYLDEFGLWFTDEKRKYLAMVERKEKFYQALRDVTDLAEVRSG